MRTTRALLAVAASLTLVTVLVGCADDPSERGGAVTSEEETGQTSDEEPTDTDRAEEPVTDDTAGRVLSDRQAESALPTIAQMPSGWSVDPYDTLGDEADDSEGENDTITPAKCRGVFDALGEANEEDAVGNASITFTQGEFGPYLGVEISSYEDDVADESFSRSLTALAECPEFTVDTHGGDSPVTFRVSRLSFADLGEESAAFRMASESEGIAASTHFAIVRVGHDVVTGSTTATGGATVDATLLERQMRGSLKRLSDG